MSKFRAPLLNIFRANSPTQGASKRRGRDFLSAQAPAELPGAAWRTLHRATRRQPAVAPPPGRHPANEFCNCLGAPEEARLQRFICWAAPVAGLPRARREPTGDYVPVIWPSVGACRERYNRCRSFLNRALSGHGCYAPPLKYATWGRGN